MSISSVFERFLSQSAVERLGWVLLHSVWQFALVALLVGVIVQLMRQNSARLRYGVLVMAMSVFAVAPAATWMLLSNKIGMQAENSMRSGSVLPQVVSVDSDVERIALSAIPASAVPADFEGHALERTHNGSDAWSLPSQSSELSSARGETWEEYVTNELRPWLESFVIAWTLGVFFGSARLFLGWLTLRRLRRTQKSIVSGEMLAAFENVARKMGVHCSVQVGQTALAHVPVVIGYFRPLVLLPASLLTSLPVGQMEAILAHELAHVRRHDFLINLLQTLLETLFFYHPAVWWVSRQIRIEREHCCDDLVVQFLGNRIEYGRALLAVEQSRARAMVFALGAANGSLLSRIRRIAGNRPIAATDRLAELSMITLVMLSCLFAIVFGTLTISQTVTTAEAGGIHADLEPSQEPQSTSSLALVENEPGKSKSEEQTPQTDRTAEAENSPQPQTSILPFEITGVVTDPQGQPVEKAVVVFPYGFDKKAWQTRSIKGETDREGRFRLLVTESDIPMYISSRGPATVWAWADGFAIGVRSIWHLLPQSGEVPIRKLGPISIQLSPPAKSAFIVKSATEKPLAGATVVPKYVRVPYGGDPIDGNSGLGEPLPEELNELVKRLADADGSVSIEMIPRQQFDSCLVVSESHGTQSVRLNGGTAEALSMRQVGSLTGRLTGGPADLTQNVRLYFRTSSAGDRNWRIEGEAITTTAQDGTFHVPAIASGVLSIRTDLDSKQKWKLSTDGPPDIWPGRDNRIDISLKVGIPVTGRLVIRGGVEPVADAELSIWSGGFRNNDSVTTDEQGEFRTFVVPGHDAAIHVNGLSPKSGLTYPQIPQFRFVIPQGVDSFRLPDIEIPRAKTWSGQLVDQMDRPISGKYVQAFVDGKPRIPQVRTDTDGRFELELRDDEIPDRWSALIKRDLFRPDEDEYAKTEVVAESPSLVLRIVRSDSEAP